MWLWVLDTQDCAPSPSHTYPRWAQRAAFVSALLPSPPHPRGLSILSTRPGISSLPRPHAAAGPQTGAHCLPRSPAPRARARHGCALPSVCLAPRQDWRPMAAPAFVSSGSGLRVCWALGHSPPWLLPALPPVPLRAYVTPPQQPMAVPELSLAVRPPRFKSKSPRHPPAPCGVAGAGPAPSGRPPPHPPCSGA